MLIYLKQDATSVLGFLSMKNRVDTPMPAMQIKSTISISTPTTRLDFIIS